MLVQHPLLRCDGCLTTIVDIVAAGRATRMRAEDAAVVGASVVAAVGGLGSYEGMVHMVLLLLVHIEGTGSSMEVLLHLLVRRQ